MMDGRENVADVMAVVVPHVCCALHRFHHGLTEHDHRLPAEWHRVVVVLLPSIVRQQHGFLHRDRRRCRCQCHEWAE